MTEQQIFDNNKAIALFLGWYESPYPNTPNKVYRRDANGKEWAMPIDQLRYHSSWNQLIPAAKKLVFDTEIDSRRYDDECTFLQDAVSSFNIEEAYKHTVQALTIYNNMQR